MINLSSPNLPSDIWRHVADSGERGMLFGYAKCALCNVEPYETRWQASPPDKEAYVDTTMSDRLRLVAPNLITFMASASALMTLYVAFYWQTRTAAWWLIAAGICDALDGVVARRLNAQSQFGNVYDSMSDFFAFGIAPAFSLVFLDLLHPAIAGLYALAIQFRLTRYSAMSVEASDTRFFQGASAPDCVYIGVLISFIPVLDFNWGFLLASLLAIYPGKLMPKGYFIVKFLIALGTLLAFMYGNS